MRIFSQLAILMNLLVLGAAVHAMLDGQALQAAVLVLVGGLNLFALSRSGGRVRAGDDRVAEDPAVSQSGRLVVAMLNLAGIFLAGVSLMYALAVLLRDPTPEQVATMPLPEGITLDEHVAAWRGAARVNAVRAGALLLGCASAAGAMLAGQWRADFGGRRGEVRGVQE